MSTPLPPLHPQIDFFPARFVARIKQDMIVEKEKAAQREREASQKIEEGQEIRTRYRRYKAWRAEHPRNEAD